jgi:NAD(P)-dependent dehydrogenase (short-subunit alcohol dehydrogenase family)
MKLLGKVAIVTGAGGGIGRAIAKELAGKGARVLAADVDPETAKRTARMIEGSTDRACWAQVDVASYESVEALVASAVELYGELNIMVNNAGISRRFSVLDLPVEEYHRVVGVNQHGVFYGIKAAGNAMKDKGGVIINTGSIYGHVVDRRRHPHHARFAYHASKGAVVMMTKAAAMELAPYGIRVLTVAPGLIETELVDSWKEDPDLWRSVQAAQMRERAGKPEDVAKVVAFLASEDAAFVNGHDFFVDDGAASFKG